LKPEAAIHPVVGSFFSTPRPRDSFESITELENIATSHRRESVHEPLSTTANSSTSFSPSVRSAHPAPCDSKDARLTDPAATNPAGVVSTDRSSRRFDSERPGSVKPDRVAPENGRAGIFENVAEIEANPLTRKFTPLMPAVLMPSPPPVTLQSPTKSGGDAAQSFASRSRATDDIEIHIGRIEVAAMQAAPIRSAPAKPPRRAASLDEYLKRRDGTAS
jgi:hypothetical protein